MIAQASSTQALSAHVPLIRRMEVASMKATEFRGVTVRRWQGECFNVDTLQDVLDVCLAIHTINKRLQVYRRLCDKQSKHTKKKKKAFHVKHNAHLICTHLYFSSRLDNEAQR